MRAAVLGSGGLGGYFGALLARAGHDVSFVARGAHLEALRANGLRIESPHGDFTVSPANATDDTAQIGPVDVVLFCVKTYDTETAAATLPPLIHDNTAVLSFQNGVESHEHIDRAVGPGHALAAPTHISSTLISPGLIRQSSPFRTTVVAEIRGPVSDRAQRIASLLAESGISATAAPDGLVPLWHKFIFLASSAGLTALARTPAAELYQSEAARGVLRAALEEAESVGRASGVAMDADIVERQYRFALNLAPGLKASMHVDLERGRRLEIDALSGAVVRLGHKLSIPTPVHQTIFAALKPHDRLRS